MTDCRHKYGAPAERSRAQCSSFVLWQQYDLRSFSVAEEHGWKNNYWSGRQRLRSRVNVNVGPSGGSRPVTEIVNASMSDGYVLATVSDVVNETYHAVACQLGY